MLFSDGLKPQSWKVVIYQRKAWKNWWTSRSCWGSQQTSWCRAWLRRRRTRTSTSTRGAYSPLGTTTPRPPVRDRASHCRCWAPPGWRGVGGARGRGTAGVRQSAREATILRHAAAPLPAQALSSPPLANLLCRDGGRQKQVPPTNTRACYRDRLFLPLALKDRKQQKCLFPFPPPHNHSLHEGLRGWGVDRVRVVEGLKKRSSRG